MATILIVDDEPQIVHLLSEIVMEAGHTPITAANGRDALALARTLCPGLIISDVRMPLMDGHTLVSILRSDPVQAQTMVILISACFEPAQTMIGTPTTLLPKPLDIPLLESLLLRFVEPTSSTAVGEPIGKGMQLADGRARRTNHATQSDSA